MSLHTVRSGGFAGIAFVILVILSVLIPWATPPDNGAPAAAIAAYGDAHRVALLIADWLGLPAAVVFTWYSVGLYRWLASVEPDEGLPLFGLINGVIANALAVLGSVIGIAFVFHASSELGPQVIRVFYDFWSVDQAITLGLTAFFILGNAMSGMRHGSLPAWLCLLGYLFAICEVAASLTSMSNSGPMALGGILGLILGLVPLLLWVLISAFVMIGKGAAAK